MKKNKRGNDWVRIEVPGLMGEGQSLSEENERALSTARGGGYITT